MMAGAKAPTKTSGTGIWGWIPSMPSLPRPSLPSLPSLSVPSWDSCKKAFGSLTSAFTSCASRKKSISDKDITVFTRITAPGATKEPCEFRISCSKKSNKTKPQHVANKSRSWSPIRIIGAVALGALGGYCIFQLLTQPRSLGRHNYTHLRLRSGNNVALPGLSTIANSYAAWAPPPETHAMERRLLSTISCTIHARVGDPFSVSINNGDLFSISQGLLGVSTNSPVPDGVTVSPDPMHVLTSVAVPNTYTMATYEGVTYFPGTGGNQNSIHAYNTANLNNPDTPYVRESSNFNAATTVITNMRVTNDRLAVTGNGLLLQLFNLAQNPYIPPSLGIASNSTIIGNSLATADGNQYGIASNQGPFVVDSSIPTSMQVTAFIPGYNCLAVAASSNSYFFGAQVPSLPQSYLISVSRTNPSSVPLQVLNLSGIMKTVDYETIDGNHYCFIGTSTNFYLVDVNDPADMKIIYSDSVGTFSMSISGNLLHYAPYSLPGIGIRDLTNITNPQVGITGVLTTLGNGVFLPVGDNIGYGRGSTYYLISGQDRTIISGTPGEGTQNTYPISFTATTSSGQVIAQTAQCELIDDPNITPGTPLTPLVFAVDQAASGSLPPGAFSHAQNLPMSLSLECPPGTPFTNLHLSPNGQWSGQLQASDLSLGSVNCLVRATQGLNTNTSPQQISVRNGPSLSSIANQVVPALFGQPFSYTIRATSLDPTSTFTYTVSGLPSTLTYSNGVISGTLPSSTSSSISYPITVTARDQNNLSTTQSFTLTAAQPNVPVWVRPLSSTQYAPLYTTTNIEIPVGAAIDQSDSNAEITYDIMSGNKDPLPNWITFNGQAIQISPNMWKAKFVVEGTYPIKLIATRTFASGLTENSEISFNVIVTGTDPYSVALVIISVLGTMWAAYKLRAWAYNKFGIDIFSCATAILNRCRPKCSLKELPLPLAETTEPIYVGQSFRVKLKTPSKQISSFRSFFVYPVRHRAFYCNFLPTLLKNSKCCFSRPKKPLPEGNELPTYIFTQEDGEAKVIGSNYIPPLELEPVSIRTYVYDRTGYKVEKLTLNIIRDFKMTRFSKIPAEEVDVVEFWSPDRKLSKPRNGISYSRDSSSIEVDHLFVKPMSIHITRKKSDKTALVKIDVAEKTEAANDTALDQIDTEIIHINRKDLHCRPGLGESENDKLIEDASSLHPSSVQLAEIKNPTPPTTPDSKNDIV